MKTVEKSAKRLLAANADDGRRLTPQFFLLEERRPPWWADSYSTEFPAMGAVYGVLVYGLDSPEESVLIGERGLGVLRGSGSLFLPYSTISGWEPLSKKPPSRSLVLRLDDARAVTVLTRGTAAFALASFVNDACWADSWREKRR